MEFYVVTYGEYSDYGILAVTADRELADKIAKKFKHHDDARVEVYKDAELVLKNCYTIFFDASGNVKNSYLSSGAYEHIENIWDFNHGQEVGVRVIHDTLEGAIKAAAERRAKYLAEKNGL